MKIINLKRIVVSLLIVMLTLGFMAAALGAGKPAHADNDEQAAQQGQQMDDRMHQRGRGGQPGESRGDDESGFGFGRGGFGPMGGPQGGFEQGGFGHFGGFGPMDGGRGFGKTEGEDGQQPPEKPEGEDGQQPPEKPEGEDDLQGPDGKGPFGGRRGPGGPGFRGGLEAGIDALEDETVKAELQKLLEDVHQAMEAFRTADDDSREAARTALEQARAALDAALEEAGISLSGPAGGQEPPEKPEGEDGQEPPEKPEGEQQST